MTLSEHVAELEAIAERVGAYADPDGRRGTIQQVGGRPRPSREPGPVAPPDVADLREQVSAFVAEWFPNPVARRVSAAFAAPRLVANGIRPNGTPPGMRGLGAYGRPRRTLADLDNLPEPPFLRAAELAASAHAAAAHVERLEGQLPAEKASDGRRIRAELAPYAEHLAAAMARLPGAIDAVLGRLAVVAPEVEAYPTVAATAAPAVWSRLGVARP